MALSLPRALQDQERESICLLSNKSPAELPGWSRSQPEMAHGGAATSSSVTGCKVTYYKDLLMSITIYKNNEHLGCFFSISNFTIENEE